MDLTLPAKKYPASTGEVAKMLGIEGVSQDLPMGTFVAHNDLPVPNLPVASSDGSSESSSHPKTISSGTSANANATNPDAVASNVKSQSKLVTMAKAGAPYIAVFLVGLFLYYFFFSAVDFNTVLTTATSTPTASTPQETAIQQLEQQDLASYQQWIKGFYYDVPDTQLLSPEADNSGNGLSNFEKYLLNLNPKSYDTLGLGMSDSQAISDGVDPLTGGPLTASQKDIVSKYIDMEAVMNRLALFNLQNPAQVAGASINANGVNSGIGDYGQPGSIATNTSTLSTYPGLNQPINSNSYTANSSSGSSSGATALMDKSVNVNTNVPGRLQIPDLKINVPIIWSQSPEDFENDLQIGVIHYPGTAMPGQIGTTYIAGHSSNYVWAKGSYNKIFSTLGNLPNDASFSITVQQTNGKDAVFNYVVTSRQQYSPTDQAQFANTGKSIVALSTCWPVGSTAKRLVVFGTLTQVQE